MLPDRFVILIIGPGLTAAFLAAFRQQHALQRGLSLAVSAGLWVLSVLGLLYVLRHGIVVLRMGNWPAPYGIVLVADILSMVMVALTMTVAVAVILFSVRTVEKERQEHFYYPLFFILLMGVNGAFLTGDLFNLFVFFEILLIASFALLALGSKPGQLRETVKYLVINL